MKLQLRNFFKAVFVSFSLCRNIFPPNLVQATIQQYQTELVPPVNATKLEMLDMSDWKIGGKFTDGKKVFKFF